MDTVLVGGFVFLLAGGAIFLAIDKVGKSDMAERSKRLITYALMGGLIVLTIGIFHWHRSVLLAEPSAGWLSVRKHPVTFYSYGVPSFWSQRRDPPRRSSRRSTSG